MTFCQVDKRRRSREIRSGLAALYGWAAVKRWAGLPPNVTMAQRAKIQESIDWERVSFAGKSLKQISEELKCKPRTVHLAARRLHIPLQKVPPRRPVTYEPRKYVSLLAREKPRPTSAPARRQRVAA